jgi:hypothetical protein
VTLVSQSVSLTGQERHRWLTTAVLIWATGVCSWLLTDGFLPLSPKTQVVGLAIALTMLGLIGAKAMSGDQSLRTALARLRLGPWIAIGFTVGFGVATLVWLGDVKTYRGLVTIPSLAPAAALVGAGFVALVLAYILAPRSILRWTSQMDYRLRGGATALGPSALSTWTLWSVAMLALSISFFRGSLGYFSDPRAALGTESSTNAVLGTLTQFGVLSTLLAAWRFSGNKRLGSLTLMIWMAGSGVAAGLLSGFKEAAIIHLVAVVVGYSARGRLRFGPLAVAAVSIVLIITPFVTAYRAAVLTSSGRLSPAQALKTVQFDKLLRKPASQGAAGGVLGAGFDRWSRIGDVAIIMNQTPFPIHYISAAELLSGPFLGLVPRTFWPGKPVLDAGYQVNHEYYNVPSSVFSFASVTPYADLYRRGGVGVVLIGMAFLGLFVRAVDNRESRSSSLDPRMLFLPMLLFPTLVKQEIDYLALSASLVSIILAAALAARLASRPAVHAS